MAVSNVIKYLLFTFNLLFFVGGIIILSFSIHMKHNKADYQMTDELLPALNLLIFIGAVTLIFGFLGCCGAFRENRCLLILFFVGLVLMLFMLLAVGALGAITRTEAAQELVMEHMEKLLPLSEQPKEVQEEFQDLERAGFCCGFSDGYLDWGNATVVPDSCNCTDTTRNCMVLDEREIYSTPCMMYIMTWLDKVSDSLMGIAFGFGILIILGLIFSLVLLCQIRNG
ncbi:tetraspanin-8-like isoform X1 [Perca fluviatilis]|uniref:tetraspanin-8-like isoform X1 n=2 Tax=Perca fluviatilis TaxID=8168 RepID=UPI0019642643|nr:tetraspanin-8-like isoform X1 [Perca fluviatilis]